MLLSLLTAMFVLLIAAFWAFQGLFSAAIMFVETIIAIMLAFGFGDLLHSLWAAQLPEYGQAIALMLIFVVALTLLRLATDKLIAGNMQFPMPVDRAGGGLLGLLSGLGLVGMVLIGIQMLPLGRSILGFERFDPTRPQDRRSIWFNPDGFVVGLVNLLSDGRFSGGSAFESAHPDYVAELASVNLGFQPESRRVVPDNCLSIKGYWDARGIEEVEQQQAGEKWTRNFRPTAPDDPSKKYLVVRVGLGDSAADDVPDETKMLRFTPAQFRLVGPPPQAIPVHSPRAFVAVGLSDLFSERTGHILKADRAARIVRWPLDMRFGLNDANAAGLKEGGQYIFDVAFEVPQDFTPWYLAFKWNARAELTKSLFRKQPPARAAARNAAPGGRPTAASDGENAEAEIPAEPTKERKKAGGRPPARQAEAAAETARIAAGDEEEDVDSAKPKRKPPAVKVGEGPSGMTHGVSAVQERTGVSALLPRVLRRKDVPGSALRGNKFVEGHIVIDDPADDVPSGEAVREFLVPSEYKLVQIGAEKVFAASLIGQALEFAKRTVAQIFVTTVSGNQYFAIGVYTDAVVNGKHVFEMQYWPSAIEEMPERALHEPKRLTANVLRTSANRNDLKMGFLFLVKPGEHIVKFSTSSRSGQDVSIEVPE